MYTLCVYAYRYILSLGLSGGSLLLKAPHSLSGKLGPISGGWKMRRAPKEEEEEDDGSLKEDESRPRRTLGTKECPKTPLEVRPQRPLFCTHRRSFWGRVPAM